MKCAIIGLGELGRAAAVGLARAGAEVIAVDRDMRHVNSVKDEVSLAVRLDASHREALASHGLAEVDVLVAAIGDNFEAQVLTVVHAKQLGVKRIVARAANPDHRRVLEAVGADEVFDPEEEAAGNMVRRLTVSNIKNYFELAEGFSLVEVRIPATLVGKTLRELELRRRHRLNLVALKRVERAEDGSEVVSAFDPVPLPEVRLEENNVLALAGSVVDLAAFMGRNP
ncbi:MAG: TrkA family potassium uptake protein [Verrucomicrobiales bacterium]|nr:TrkA family potassium uptake protein [Verrucomicrobiales bacterium]MCP5526176.1 TrkA family potassium uptake protein [Verrucomicrobiales bacterium]